ncbi:MAG: YkgJ family cysteine cluster protein [Myxococcales bacterium]|nr:YkgJ family cysteine cluster protein [Myxococcales bacterium]MDD9967414.1 YkgJ family cysteine cluster protein [Myxococcales bacterium]
MSAEVPDCLACGVCCRDAGDGRVLVSAEDLVRWRREGRDDILGQIVPGHFSQDGLAADEQGTCVHLRSADGRVHCSIYETRAQTCRDLEPGSSQCRTYRRLAGLE